MDLAQPRPSVLLLCDDPVASHLLRGLLCAIPATRPEIIVPEPGDDPFGLAHRGTLCFLEPGYGGMPSASTLARLRTAAPALRVVGLLAETSRHGDRADLLRALQSGMEQVLLLEELSVAGLQALLRDARAPAPTVQPAYTPPEPIALRDGGWRIALGEQRAVFDQSTLAALGHGTRVPGTGLADWKSLIHPQDVDRLVSEVQCVLEGTAPPHAVHYRLRRGDGSWAQVVSDDIVVELDTDGAPRAIAGRFHSAEAPRPPTQPEPAAPATMQAPVRAPDDSLAAHCQTAMTRFHQHTDGSFRLSWCNAAAAALAGEAVASLVGRPAAEVTAPCDGFSVSEALARVASTGIAESRDALVLGRAEPPAWRRHQLSRLQGGDVLLELIDVSELVNTRQLRRTEDELAQYVVRSLPLTTLLVDENGRVMRCLSAAGGALGEDCSAIEDRSLQELLGPVAGEACLQQVVRTLNTGRSAVATLARDTTAHASWIECHTTLLRARPGLPTRVLLGVLDATARVTESMEARAAADQLRAALQALPLPLWLKDADGRYAALNPAFERLMGIEEGMLIGKTDFEVFPDDVAAELHDGERRACDEEPRGASLRDTGVGPSRAPRWCFEFPVRGSNGGLLGCGGVWFGQDSLPAGAREAPGSQLPVPVLQRTPGGLVDATASVVNHLEDALTHSGDYAGALRQLEQLVETTMQAQAIIHNVAGQPSAPLPPRPLVALAPLAQEIVDLERILVPATAHFENHIDDELPPARCEPVAFHQILLRAIRHARRTLGAEGTLCIRLRASTGGGRGCLSCHGGFDGNYVELVIEDSDSRITESDISQLADAGAELRSIGSALDDLAVIHALAHAQGGHLQIQRNVPTGTSVHVFFRAGAPEELAEALGRSRATIARFPRGRSGGRS